jgi:hypothetical protein
MAYDPIVDAERFRKALQKLAESEGLSALKIIEMYNRERPAGNDMAMSVATLQRFINGDNVRLIAQLRFIYNMLFRMTDYRPYLEKDAGEVVDLPSALAAFFAPQGNVPPRYSTDVVRKCLPGEYVMVRRDFNETAEADDVRASTVTIEAADNGVVIEERQDFQQPLDARGYRQRDSGYLFPYADYVYFLMKEAGDPATAVKLGVISFAMPDFGDGQADYFAGHVFVSSRRGIFPLARFACRRYAPELHPQKSSILKLADLQDIRALNHIKPDYV